MKFAAETTTVVRAAIGPEQAFTTSVNRIGTGARAVGLQLQLNMLSDPADISGDRDQHLVTDVIEFNTDSPSLRRAMFAMANHALTNLFLEGKALYEECVTEEYESTLKAYIASGEWIIKPTDELIRQFYDGGQTHPAVRVTDAMRPIIQKFAAALKASLPFKDDAAGLEAWRANRANRTATPQAVDIDEKITSIFSI